MIFSYRDEEAYHGVLFLVPGGVVFILVVRLGQRTEQER